ncbi:MULTISPECIES: RNA-guided endonuclease IscB [unclassified Microcoleus]|uniref:RNA-guided endonuclease IscB n=1 Tax=unclassified Microcoleus TaxID=2642155 RepID=UPI0025D08A74|nr:MULTISPECIES: RNA-guided endonuclease IscB [unclassified Microcoleus]
MQPTKQQNWVFQINGDKQPLDMIHPGRCRELQNRGKLASFRRFPYVVIQQKNIESLQTKEYILKIDPGSQWTGFAIQCGNDILFRAELNHRGESIKLDLVKRAGFRRGRRSRNLRYRKKRFNRAKPEGWLAPSIRHRVLTVETWIKRFMRYCPIACIEIEQVRFDLQKLPNPEIDGVEYQQGELQGYEVREYLLQKWGRKCAYCGTENVSLEVEHIQPKSKGGSNRIGNLTLACHACNIKKGNLDVRDFLAKSPDILQQVLENATKPLKDAAAVNSTRSAIVKMAKSICENVKCYCGARTKMNRSRQGLEKTHSLDAACVGESGASIRVLTDRPLLITCKGHGSRQSIRVNASGFPAVKNAKTVFTHIAAGDVVRFTIGKDRKKAKAGTYTARVKTPTPKGFEVLIDGARITLSTMSNVVFIHRSDGYGYEL